MSNRNTTSQGLHNPNITIRFAEHGAATASNPTARHQNNTLDRVNKLSDDMLACQLDYEALKEDHEELVATVRTIETNQREGLLESFFSGIWRIIVFLFVVFVVVSVGFLYVLLFHYLSTDEHEFQQNVQEIRRNVMELCAESGPIE